MAKVKEIALSQPALESYRDQGYWIEEDVWPSHVCKKLIGLANEFAPAYHKTYSPRMQPHRTHHSFLAAMKNPVILGIAEQLCGGKVSGLQSTWYYGAPGTPGFNAHQDNYFVETRPDTFVSAWSAMQDVTPDMGGVVGYPRSHLLGTLSVAQVNRPGSDSQDPNATKEEVIFPKAYAGLNLFVPQGATLFMHADFVHSTGTNTTDQFRRALLLTYIRRGEPFRPGNTAKRAEVEVY